MLCLIRRATYYSHRPTQSIKRLIKRLCRARLWLAFVVTFPTHAATSTSASNTAAAIVITPITVATTANLVFGAVQPKSIAGSVTLSPSGTRTGSNVVLSSMELGNAARFNITGYANANFTIALPNNIILTGPGTEMTLSSFTSDLETSSTISAAGTATLTVGGTLAIAANQAPGAYSGSFNVTVNYQ